MDLLENLSTYKVNQSHVGLENGLKFNKHVGSNKDVYTGKKIPKT